MRLGVITIITLSKVLPKVMLSKKTVLRIFFQGEYSITMQQLLRFAIPNPHSLKFGGTE